MPYERELMLSQSIKNKKPFRVAFFTCLIGFSVQGIAATITPDMENTFNKLVDVAGDASKQLPNLRFPNPIAYPFKIINKNTNPPQLETMGIFDSQGHTTPVADQILNTQTGCGNQQVTLSRSQLVHKVLGPQAAEKYLKSRNITCRLVGAAAQVKYRVDLHAEAEKNGLYLFQFSKSEKKHFPGNRHRTLALSGGMLWNPNYAANEVSDQKMKLMLYFKFSDNDPIDLRNVVQSLKNMNQGGDSHRALCLLVDGQFYIDLREHQALDKIQPQICTYIQSVTDTTVNMNVFAKYRFLDDDRTYDLGVVPVPAPFGYLNDLNNYKASLKQNMQTELKNKIVNLLGLDSQLMTLLSQVK